MTSLLVSLIGSQCKRPPSAAGKGYTYFKQVEAAGIMGHGDNIVGNAAHRAGGYFTIAGYFLQADMRPQAGYGKLAQALAARFFGYGIIEAPRSPRLLNSGKLCIGFTIVAIDAHIAIGIKIALVIVHKSTGGIKAEGIGIVKLAGT